MQTVQYNESASFVTMCDECGQNQSICGHTASVRTLPVHTAWSETSLDIVELGGHGWADPNNSARLGLELRYRVEGARMDNVVHPCQGCHIVLYGTYDEKCSACEYEDMLPILDKLALS